MEGRYRNSADYRLLARSALAGKWRAACEYFVIVALVSMAVSLIGRLIDPSGVVIGMLWGSVDVKSGIKGTLEAMPTWAWALSVTLTIAGAIAQPVVTVGSYASIAPALEGEIPSAQRGFECFPLMFKAFGMSVVRTVVTTLGYICLIVPGILLTFGYSMAEYLLYRHPEMGAIEALRVSRRIMYGRKMRFFLLNLSFIGWVLLQSIATSFALWLLTMLLPVGETGQMFLSAILAFIPSMFLNVYMYTAFTAFFADAEAETREAGRIV